MSNSSIEGICFKFDGAKISNVGCQNVHLRPLASFTGTFFWFFNFFHYSETPSYVHPYAPPSIGGGVDVWTWGGIYRDMFVCLARWQINYLPSCLAMSVISQRLYLLNACVSQCHQWQRYGLRHCRKMLQNNNSVNIMQSRRYSV